MKISKKSLIQKLIGKLSRQYELNHLRVVLADEQSNTSVSPQQPNIKTQEKVEPHQDPVPQPSAPQVNYEQLIASARKEEKDKLYPQIEKLKKDKEELIAKQNQYLLQLGEKDAKIAELQKGATKSKELKELKDKLAILESENSSLKKEKELAKLETFKKAEIEKVNGQVIPELIKGETEEEIKKSIEFSNKRYLEIIASVQGAQSQAPTSPAPSLFNTGVTSPMNLGTVTPEMIANMSASEYAKYRKTIGLED